MRADRLIAVLLLLQTRGRVTAAEVARELEVSLRTARRDLEALGTAGVPVYSAAGRGGGWSLVGGARTDLTGLTVDEARALFLAAGSSTAATPGVQAALRKLLAALPAPLRQGARAAGDAIVVDPASWDRTPPPAPPHLDVLRQAVLDGHQVVLGYAGRAKPPSIRTVSPLGLVAKSGVWYLVAGTDEGVRTFRVGRITDVAVTGEAVVRPEGFDLAAAWRESAAAVEARRGQVAVRAVAEPAVVPRLRSLLGGRLRLGSALPGGRVEVEVSGPAVAFVAAELAGFGARVEVVDPPEAREHLAALGAELSRLYGAVRADPSNGRVGSSSQVRKSSTGMGRAMA